MAGLRTSIRRRPPNAEKAALSLVRYAPRRVTLPPNQPQSIRVGLNPADTLPDGEYRVHMLFRAIPKTQAVTDEANASELKIQLIPLYGITIPIIVRKGDLTAYGGSRQRPHGPRRRRSGP
jgi:P pilus assembly chaperone PapD